MKRFLSIILFVISAAFLHGEEYIQGPDSQPHEGVPKGSVTKYELKAGRFYPGTPHTYFVYVPAQYDANKPTAFMIFLDGGYGAMGDDLRVPVVFDNLIAKHDLPPLIGIFIDPGILPSLSDQAQNRYERIFEYDSMSDCYARFLIEELIPEVGKRYNLSRDPNDRGISGNSTGSVGAFMAAWNRPDEFRRVLSFCGTFLAMKGADSLPALVRKAEPKPLRIFMQDGVNDHIVPSAPFGTFYAGSWPIDNKVMFEALEYSGYDVKFVMGSGGHDLKQGGAILPDALRWLWRDYPNPIVVHEPEAMHGPDWDPRGKVYATVAANKPWQKIEGSYDSAVSPTADREGNIYFADPSAHRIYKLTSDGKLMLFRSSTSAMALRVGPDDRLYASQPSLRRIVSYGAGGDERLVARDIEAGDIAITASGAIYFTDKENKTVGFIDTRGHTRIVYDGGEIAVPAGIALSPDQAMLVVSDAQSRFSWSFQIVADGSLMNGEPFYRLEMPENGWMSNAGEVAEDSDGLVYFATPLGVQICEANGRMGEILNAPEPGPVIDLTFGGANPAWLYVIEGNYLFRRQVKVKAAVAWAASKPPKPLL
jgi:sugar lactone lactonase YvrE